MNPSYIEAFESGILRERVEKAYAIIRNCTLCPRSCRVNRLEGQKGFCKTAQWPIVSSYGPHFGEEDPLVGTGGSGTIFITHCNLLCVFCQNHDVSHLGSGELIAIEGISEIMVRLQNQGCHNINFVSPTHAVPMILAALPLAIERGLSIPLVYNSSGYDRVESLMLLEGIFDLYMPDFKFWSPDICKKYMNAPDYPEHARQAIKEMHRQTGDLAMDSRGIARRGLLVRHLVMPEGLAGTREIMRFICHEVSPNTYVNIMAQYRPCYKAHDFPELSRTITRNEYAEALSDARNEGITRLDHRERRFAHG